MTSVIQIVEQVIDNLSDSCSQLMLLLIVFQEKNVAMPPQLPGAVSVVSGSAGTLTTVGHSLANTDYADYPEIKQRIDEASDEVGEASQQILVALQDLQTNADRRVGWDGLVQSVKTMSAKTINMLQVVYGADRERAIEAAKRAAEAAAKVELETFDRNPKDFAADVSQAVTKANQLAAFLKGKAETTESPVQQQELLELAEELQAKSRQLIVDGNNFLKNPDDPDVRSKLIEDLDDLRGTIDRAHDYLVAMGSQFDDALDRFESTSTSMIRGLDELRAAGLNSYAEDILYTAKKQREFQTFLLEDLKRADRDGAQRNLTYLEAENQTLAKLATLEADLVEELDKKQNLNLVAQELEELVAQYVPTAERAIDGDSRAAVEVGQQAKRLEEKMAELDALVRTVQAEIGASAHKEMDSLVDLGEAAKNADALSVSRAAKSVVRENKSLMTNAKLRADEVVDAVRSKQIRDAADQLDKLLPYNILAAKEAMTKQTDAKAIEKMDATTATMISQVVAVRDLTRWYPEIELLDAVQRERELMEQLRSEAQAGNKAAIGQTSPVFLNNSTSVGELAKQLAARKPERSRQAKIVAAVQKLEATVPPTVVAAQTVAGRPADAGNRQQLDTRIKEINLILDLIVAETDAEALAAALRQMGELNALQAALRDGDAKRIAEEVRKLAQRTQTLAAQARAMASRTDDPMRRKQLTDDADELEELMAEAAALANYLLQHPDDVEAQRRLQEVLARIAEITDGVIDPSKRVEGHKQVTAAALLNAAQDVANNPRDASAVARLEKILTNLPLDDLETQEEKLAAMAHEQHELIAQLTAAAERGDRRQVEALSQQLQAHNEQLTAFGRQVAESSEDAALRKKVQACCDDLQALVPEVISQARVVVGNPNEPLARAKLSNVAQRTHEETNHLYSLLAPAAEDRLVQSSIRQRNALDELQKNYTAGNVAGTTSSMEAVKKYNAQVVEAARKLAETSRDPAAAKRILDAINELEALMPMLEVHSAAAARSPTNAAAKRQADADVDKCRQLLDQLVRDSKSDLIGLAHKENNLLDAIMVDTHRRDAQTAAADIKQLVETQKALTAAALAEAALMTNARSKQNVENAVSELNALLPLHVQATKNAMADPSEANLKALADSTAAMKAPIAQIVATTKPTPDNVADANRRREAALLAKLRDAAKRGDKPETESCLRDVDTLNQRLVAQARAEAEKAGDPVVKKELTEAAFELERLHSQLGVIARAAADNPTNAALQAKLAEHTAKMEHQMDRIVNAIAAPPPSNKDKAQRLASAMLQQAKSGRVDSKKFMLAAQTLANMIGSLGGYKDLVAGKDLETLLRELDATASGQRGSGARGPNDDLDSLLKFIEDQKKKKEAPAPAPVKAKARPKPEPQMAPKALPKTLDGMLDKVAQDLRATINPLDNDPISVHVRNIGLSFEKMSNAAKKGNRQDMVQAARDAAAEINLLLEKLRPLAENCRDPATKDRLLRQIQALKNLSTQLKILTAVKAANKNVRDADSDGQLISVVHNIGTSMTEAVNCVKTIEGSKLVAKKK